MQKYFSVIFFFVFSALLFAQPSERLVKVIITPNSDNWEYLLGEKAKFEVVVTKNSIPQKNVKIRYELSYDMMDPFKKEDLVLKDGKLTIDAGTMETAGFLRCRVFAKLEDNEYEGRATAGYAPLTIKATTQMPEDFLQFWNQAKSENAKIPMEPRLRLLDDRCNAKVNVYELSIQNYQSGSRIYGILCVPKAPGKYPAILRVPGAGVRPYFGNVSDAENGIISLEIGIHGIPVTMDRNVYDELYKAGLNDYQYNNWDNRDKVYYKRVFLGCVRAVDYIFSMEQFDGENVAVQGGSQGGALSIVTAALDTRIKGLVAFYPALCDLGGYLHNRAGGWPHLFKDSQDQKCVLQQKVKASQYYDVVNFARLIKVPGFYSFGFNDMVCPPTTTFSAINEITAPKTLVLVPEVAHYGYPEQFGKALTFISKILKDNK